MIKVHKPKTEIGKKKFEIAKALNTIINLQNAHKNKELTAEQRSQLFNTSMRTVCDLLDIDLNMQELLKMGSEGFSYSDTEEDTKELEKFLNSPKQPQETLKSILEALQDMTHKAHSLSAGDSDVFGDLVSGELDRIFELLGMTELSITAEVNEKLPVTTIKTQLQDVYSLNDSMFTGDPNYIPRYTDGSEIKAKDVADMNMHALEAISELLGFELEEGATPVKTKDQETYDNLPAEDKLNVDMLDKLHEVQNHVLNSGQTAVSMNQVQTAISLLECSLGVMGKVEE